MGFNTTEYTDAEWKAVNEGKLCPNSECKSSDIICVGAAPDGRWMNLAYDCKTCGQEWEAG